MINNGTSGYKPQEVISLRPGKNLSALFSPKTMDIQKRTEF